MEATGTEEGRVSILKPTPAAEVTILPEDESEEFEVIRHEGDEYICFPAYRSQHWCDQQLARLLLVFNIMFLRAYYP